MNRAGKKILALLLGLALTVCLLPAGSAEGAVSGDELRAATVRRVEEIMDVRWSVDKRVAWGSLGEEKTAAMQAGGAHPVTYFEYARIRFTYTGMMMETDPVTPEEFDAWADKDKADVPGIGKIPNEANVGRGMDVNSFLTDVTSRTLSQPVAGLRQALRDPGLVPLAQADLSAASSKAGISAADAAAGYAKLGAGDLLLAWDNAADKEDHPLIHALVVKSADAANKRVTVLYPAYSKVLWYFKCDSCGAVETEGPTSAVCPDHINSTAAFAFASYKSHKETDPTTSCTGSWKSDYGTTWREETVSFDQLYGEGGGVPCGSAGYLPYTFAAYQTGLAPANVKVSTDITPANYTAGFAADVTSDYRITGLKAVVTEQSGVTHSSVSAPAYGSTSAHYADKETDLAMLGCKVGTTNNLSLYVRSGPMSREDLARDDWRLVMSMDFHVDEAAVRIAADRTQAAQGENFTVSVLTVSAGFTGLRVSVSYDRDSYVFDQAASRTASAGTDVTEKDGTITCERYGGAMAAGATVAKLVFAPVRTGLFPIEAAANGVIRCTAAGATDKASPSAADLVSSGLDPTPIQLAAGYNADIRRGYVGDWDLILIYTNTPIQRNDNRNSKTKLTYDGKTMYDVTAAQYDVDGDRYLRTYGYLAKNADAARVAAGTEDCPELAYDHDVNGSGIVDLNDVQAIANILRGDMPPEGNMARWLTADVDRSGRVDAADRQALWALLVK